MQEGEYVQVRGLSRQYEQYETLAWKIAAMPDQDGKNLSAVTWRTGKIYTRQR